MSGPTSPGFGPTMPVPKVEPLTAPFWAAAREQRLVIQRCTDCGTFRHLPHALCARCQSTAHDWVGSAGRGRVYTYTVVTHPVHEAAAAAVPYTVVVVELDDCGGVMVPGNLVGDPPVAACVGMPVEVVFDPVTDEVWVPRFRAVV